MRELNSYTFVDPHYFEPLSRHTISSDYEEVLRQLLPDDWEVSRHDLWLMAASHRTEIPPQGFKIHLSATFHSAREVLRRVVPECAQDVVAFKVVADPLLLGVVGSKNYGRGASSKFITIYPRDMDQFRRLIGRLDDATKQLEGAYILSDRRYRDKGVVYYRYGGFLPRYALNVTGTREPVIGAPDGTLQPDPRLPFFELPEWVDDPFGNSGVPEPEDEPVLGQRYRVLKALSFSNAGGVYLALDTRTGNEVIVKEARPFTACWIRGSSLLDAVEVLHREAAVLRDLEQLPFIPRLIDEFKEWEHHYLVQEKVPGIPLAQFRARDEVALIPFTGEAAKTDRFSGIFRDVAGRLLQMVETVHQQRIVIGDLSPNNILIDPETRQLSLIDLESSHRMDAAEGVERFSVVWATPGFRAPDRMERPSLQPRDDIYALGMVLCSMLLPVQALFELEPRAMERFIARISLVVGLPSDVPNVIRALLNGDAAGARMHLQAGARAPGARQVRRVRPARGRKPPASDALLEAGGGHRDALLLEQLPEATRRVAECIVSTTTPDRTDRLWPTDFTAFQTNALSIAYGACGTALFLKTALGALPAEAESWILNRTLDHREYPPGLYLGLAGIACTLHQLGYPERAAEVMREVARSPLRFTEASLFHGAAGWGLASLQLHHRTGDVWYLELAATAAEHLARTARPATAGCWWPSTLDDRRHFGLAYGGSGIGLFLLHFAAATGEARESAFARSAIEHDLAGAVQGEGLPRWGRYEDDTLVEPYWMHGGAGIGIALLQFAQQLGEERYLQEADRAARSCFTRFTVLPGQFEGLSGIGELHLDLFLATGEQRYLACAVDIARSILCYQIERPVGIAFPGRHLLRISHDYGYGSAGVGLFLHRLMSPGPGLFQNWAPPLTAPSAIPA
jgi:serine/threonine protein kinase